MVANPVDRPVCLKQQLVSDVSHVRQPSEVLHDGIEFVSVDDEHLPVIGGLVNGIPGDLDISENTGEFRNEFVVVAGNIDQARSLARFSQQLLDYVIVGLGPIAAPPERPDVDEVADQVKRLELVLPEKFEEPLGLAAWCSQMHVGDPSRAVVIHGRILA